MTDETAPEEPIVTSTSHAGLRKPLFALAALILLMLIFGQVMPRLFPPQHPSAANDQALLARLDQLEARIKTLEEAPKPAAAAGASEDTLAALQAKINQLQQQVEHPAVSAADMQADMKALHTQMDALRARQSNQLAALAAFGLLKDAVRRGDAVTTEITQLTSLTQGNAKAQAALAELEKASAQGIPALSGLQSGFEAALPKALAQDHPGVLAHELQSLIRIRKVGDQPGQDDEAVIARAETRLNRGEVEAAVKELSALSASAGKALVPWLAQAQAYLQAHQALNALQLALTEPSPAETPAAAADTDNASGASKP